MVISWIFSSNTGNSETGYSRSKTSNFLSNYPKTDNTTGKGDSYVGENAGVKTQVKRSGSNNITRSLTGYDPDSADLLIELFATMVAQSFFGAEKIPNMVFIKEDDKNSKNFRIGSEYLPNFNTLDGYVLNNIKDKHPEQKIKAQKGAHAKFCYAEGKLTAEINYRIEGERRLIKDSIEIDESMKKEIYEMLLLSMLLQDHDINPGNLGVSNGKVCRIDFGKACGSLIRTKTTIPDSFLMNYANAKQLDYGGGNKLHRDYPGILQDPDFLLICQNALTIKQDSLKATFDGTMQGLDTVLLGCKEHNRNLLKEMSASFDTMARMSKTQRIFDVLHTQIICEPKARGKAKYATKEEITDFIINVIPFLHDIKSGKITFDDLEISDRTKEITKAVLTSISKIHPAPSKEELTNEAMFYLRAVAEISTSNEKPSNELWHFLMSAAKGAASQQSLMARGYTELEDFSGKLELQQKIEKLLAERNIGELQKLAKEQKTPNTPQQWIILTPNQAKTFPSKPATFDDYLKQRANFHGVDISLIKEERDNSNHIDTAKQRSRTWTEFIKNRSIPNVEQSRS